MLSLYTPYDVQLALAHFVKTTRKSKRISVKALSEKSGVPNSTIRLFEKTGKISMPQFLMIYAQIGQLENIHALTKIRKIPKTLDEVLDLAKSE
tara:strand:+ start:781 stop:1062 length:282 start_codon:yes stop_codon:yes gene_type:complete